MTTEEQISDLIASHQEPKRTELHTLHRLVLQGNPECRLWFFDGKNSEGRVVANPTIGYGLFINRYAGGKTADTFRIGISANKSGISVYILGLADKSYLSRTFGAALGKATVTGYCIKFKSLKEIDLSTLEAAISFGLGLEP